MIFFFFFLIGITNLDAYEEEIGNEDGQKYLAFSLDTGEKGKCGGRWQVGLRCGFRGDRAEASSWIALDLKGASSHPPPPILLYWTTAHIAWFHQKKKKKKGKSQTFLSPNFKIRSFQMFKLDLEKVEEPEIKLPTFVGSSKKQESSRKTSTALLIMLKP